MHRLTYYRLFAMAIKAQERVIALALEDLRRRYPEQSWGLTVVSPHARPPVSGSLGPDRRVQ
jgi:hypothetical protein